MEGAVCMRCQAPAKLQCPKCLELNLPKATYCSQDCFKAEWAQHKAAHKPAAAASNGDAGWAFCTKRGRGRSATMPAFLYTGALRPHKIGPMRQVPDHIPKPDWSITGTPANEEESRQQRTVVCRSAKELAGIRAACQAGRRILDKAHAAVAPGVTTDEIDRIVHDATIEEGAYPSPLNYYGFPKSVCTSINEVICHGIPDQRELQEGDIVNVDVTAFLAGWHGDLNETFLVGKVDEQSRSLVKATHDAMMKAIALCKPGVRFRDVGEVISKHVHPFGFSVVKTYCGHGIGDLFHCAPNIPHYTHNKAAGVMKEGMVFTIEPMINTGSWRDVLWPDGWTASTVDGGRSAQFEHQIAITPTGAEILTARTPDSPPLWWEAEGGGGDDGAQPAAAQQAAAAKG